MPSVADFPPITATLQATSHHVAICCISNFTATKIVFNATGQQYRQTTSFTYLGGTVTEMPNLSDEIDRRIRAGWMGFKRYKRELYDRSKASLLPLKARMVSPVVVEALLSGCVTWTSLKCLYAKLRTKHHRMLLRILGAWCKWPNKRILSYKDALQRTKCESIETTVRTRRLLWAGALLRMGDHRLPKRVMSGELENAGKRGPGGKEKERIRAAWQMIFGYLASRGTGKPPHLTLGRCITQYTKGVVGLWPRG